MARAVLICRHSGNALQSKALGDGKRTPNGAARAARRMRGCLGPRAWWLAWFDLKMKRAPVSTSCCGIFRVGLCRAWRAWPGRAQHGRACDLFGTRPASVRRGWRKDPFGVAVFSTRSRRFGRFRSHGRGAAFTPESRFRHHNAPCMRMSAGKAVFHTARGRGLSVLPRIAGGHDMRPGCCRLPSNGDDVARFCNACCRQARQSARPGQARSGRLWAAMSPLLFGQGGQGANARRCHDTPQVFSSQGSCCQSLLSGLPPPRGRTRRQRPRITASASGAVLRRQPS